MLGEDAPPGLMDRFVAPCAVPPSDVAGHGRTLSQEDGEHPAVTRGAGGQVPPVRVEDAYLALRPAEIFHHGRVGEEPLDDPQVLFRPGAQLHHAGTAGVRNHRCPGRRLRSRCDPPSPRRGRGRATRSAGRRVAAASRCGSPTLGHPSKSISPLRRLNCSARRANTRSPFAAGKARSARGTQCPAYPAICWRALTRRRSTEGQSSRISGKLRGDASLG
jgi:hypothetical protein